MPSPDNTLLLSLRWAGTVYGPPETRGRVPRFLGSVACREALRMAALRCRSISCDSACPIALSGVLVIRFPASLPRLLLSESRPRADARLEPPSFTDMRPGDIGSGVTGAAIERAVAAICARGRRLPGRGWRGVC